MKKQYTFLVLLVVAFSFSFAYSQLTPQQQQQKDQIINIAMQGLKDPYAGFQPIADEARCNFKSNTLPQIAAQYGGLGGTNSSGYKGMMSGAGQGLERQLAAMKIQYGIQNIIQYQQLLALGLNIQ